MKILLFLLTFFLSANCFGQVLFAPSESTPANDRPTCAVEIPGSRYAFAISQEDSLHPGTGINTLVVIADVNGQVLHRQSFIGDTFKVCRASDIHYVNNRLYLSLTLGKDSLGQNLPIFTALVEMDTNLNVLNKNVYTVGDSAYFVYTNHSVVVNNVIYGLYGKTKNFSAGVVIHPVIRAYDLNGVLLRERELDTTFFNPPQIGPDYSMRPVHFSSNNSSLVIAVASGKTQGSGVSTHTYVLSLDTLFNLQKVAPVGCVGSLCQSLISFLTWSVYGLNQNRYLIGGALDSNLGQKYAILKYDFSGSIPINTDYYASTYSTISDSSKGKFPALNHMSGFDNSLFCVGHTSWWYPVFSSYKNQLIVAKCDTNATVIWTKYIGGDAHYFPANILATSDHGCLVLAYKYDATVPTNRFDHYIFKLDGNGNLMSLLEVESGAKKFFKVFPNPAHNSLNVTSMRTEQFTGHISDMAGRVVLEVNAQQPKTAIDISTLPPGVYSYHFTTARGRFTQTGLWLKR